MEACDKPYDPCPISRMLDVIGERWSFLIIRDVFYGVRRFDALQKNLGISKKVLSIRLNKLVEAEVLKRVPYLEKPQRFEYRFTARGRELFPVLLTMSRWGNRWLNQPGKPTVVIRHQNCGQLTEGQVVCEHCGELLKPAEIKSVVQLPSAASQTEPE